MEVHFLIRKRIELFELIELILFLLDSSPYKRTQEELIRGEI